MSREGQRGPRRSNQRVANNARSPWFRDSLIRLWDPGTPRLPAYEPAGPTNHTRTVDDVSGSTDTGQSLGHEGALTDNADPTDAASSSLTSSTNWTQTVTDSSGSTDTVGRALTKGITDVAGSTDSVGLTFGRTITDGAGLTDTGQSLGHEGRVTDSADPTDDASGSITVGGVNYTETVDDVSGSTDAGQSLGHDGRVTDSAATTDSTSGVTFVGTGITRTITDASGSTDAGQSLGHSGRTIDNAGSTDTPQVQYDAGTNVNFTRAPTDLAGVTDSVTAIRGLGKVVDDDAGLTEHPVYGRIDYIEAIDDTAGLTDRVIRSEPMSDNAGSTDQTLVTKGPGVPDLAGLTDAVALALGITITEDTGSVDQVFPIPNPPDGTIITVELNDNARSGDDLVIARGVVTVEDAGSVDGVSFSGLTTAQTYALTLTDLGGATDTAGGTRNVPAGTDSAGVTDDVETSVYIGIEVTVTDESGALDSTDWVFVGLLRITATSQPALFDQIRDMNRPGGAGRLARGVAVPSQRILLLEQPSVTYPQGRVVVTTDCLGLDGWDDVIRDPQGYVTPLGSWQADVLTAAGFVLEGAP